MTVKIMKKMVDYFGTDVRRINHALKVLNFAQLISDGLVSDEKVNNIIQFTALLHDIGIKESERKHNSTAGNFQELEGPPIAEKILKELNIPVEIVNRVCFIIGNHHSYSKIDGLDFQIIVEADFLVNIYEDNMDESSVNSICNRVFKTEQGKYLLKKMYLNKSC